MPAQTSERLRQLWANMGKSKTPMPDLDFSDGLDLSNTPGAPITLKSPNETVYNVSVTDDGTLEVTPV